MMRDPAISDYYIYNVGSTIIIRVANYKLKFDHWFDAFQNIKKIDFFLRFSWVSIGALLSVLIKLATLHIMYLLYILYYEDT